MTHVECVVGIHGVFGPLGGTGGKEMNDGVPRIKAPQRPNFSREADLGLKMA